MGHPEVSQTDQREGGGARLTRIVGNCGGFLNILSIASCCAPRLQTRDGTPTSHRSRSVANSRRAGRRWCTRSRANSGGSGRGGDAVAYRIKGCKQVTVHDKPVIERDTADVNNDVKQTGAH